MDGKVKFYNMKKGFGFIQGDDGKDYFVHHTGLKNGVFLKNDDIVSFEATQNDRGLAAKDVNLIKKGSEVEGSASFKGKKSEEKKDDDQEFSDEQESEYQEEFEDTEEERN
jgi:CspA family cold shock protein